MEKQINKIFRIMKATLLGALQESQEAWNTPDPNSWVQGFKLDTRRYFSLLIGAYSGLRNALKTASSN